MYRRSGLIYLIYRTNCVKKKTTTVLSQITVVELMVYITCITNALSNKPVYILYFSSIYFTDSAVQQRDCTACNRLFSEYNSAYTNLECSYEHHVNINSMSNV